MKDIPMPVVYPTQIPGQAVPLQGKAPIPSAAVSNGAGAGTAPNPAWADLVNQHHENAHNTNQAQRDVVHNAGRAGFVDAAGQVQGQSNTDQQAFVSVTRPPDTQSY